MIDETCLSVVLSIYVQFVACLLSIVCTPVPKLEAKDSQPVNVPSTERPGVPAPSVSITPQPAFGKLLVSCQISKMN